jgi:NADPH:quinone reductase-like Zn-dependent oxidoreductase
VKQLVITRHGGPDVLQIREAPDPALTPGGVRIRMRAAGINFSDILARQGLYPDAPKPPCTVGYEVAGVVEAVAPGLETPRVGDAVVATTQFGGQSEVVVAPAARVFPLPPGWSFEEGAGLPVVYLTAHHVLVHAAAGGVGLAVAELGKILQLRVIGLASPGKHDVLRRYGVEPLDGRDPHWPAAVRRVAAGGVDVILDAVGGDSWRQGYRLLAPGGRLICFGASALSQPGGRHLLAALWQLLRFPRFGPLALMNDNRAVAGVNIGHLWNQDAMLRPQIAALLRYAAEGRIKPRVDRAFPLADAAAAHRYIQERKNIGKVVLVST